MTFLATNDYVVGRKNAVTTNEPGVQVMRFTLDLKAADMAANSIGAFGVLPATAVPIGLILDTDATNGVGLVAQFGVLTKANDTAFSTAAADGGSTPWATSAAASASVTAQQLLSRTMMNDVAPTNFDRFIGMKITTPGVAAAQTVGLTLLYRQV
jgi:hypothetical protein